MDNGRPSTPQMKNGHGGGMRKLKNGFLNQNPEAGHNSLTQTMVNHTGVTLMGAASVPHWSPG